MVRARSRRFTTTWIDGDRWIDFSDWQLMIDLNEIVMEAGRLDDDVDAVSIRYSGGCIHPGRSFYTIYIMVVGPRHDLALSSTLFSRSEFMNEAR